MEKMLSRKPDIKVDAYFVKAATNLERRGGKDLPSVVFPKIGRPG